LCIKCWVSTFHTEILYNFHTLQIPLKEGIRGERQGDFTDNSATLHVYEKMKSSPRDSTFQEEISIYVRVFLKVMPCWAWVSPLIWCLIPFLLSPARSSNKDQTLKTQYEHAFNNFFITPHAAHLINYAMLEFRGGPRSPWLWPYRLLMAICDYVVYIWLFMVI
jgi:hypothetical protein